MPIEPPAVTPRSLDEAYDLLAGGNGWRPIAGGTDLMVQITGELGEPPAGVVDLWRLDALRGLWLEPDGGWLAVGALTTYSALRRSALVSQHLPALVEAASMIGAAQIQNRGTIGGNIATASPAGDTLPVLLASDALIVLGSRDGEREVAATDFWTGYRQTARRQDELVVRVRFPIERSRTIRFRKVGTRRAQAISKVVLAVGWQADAGAWRNVRVAVGSVAPVPMRARMTERVLEGKSPDPAIAGEAAAAIEREVSPIDDVRSTADYRRTVAARILHRLIRDEGGW